MAKKKPKKTTDDEPGFEEAIERLEEIVRKLEEGQIGLEDALRQYEIGVTLLRKCYDLLGKAERRIELLSGLDADGNPTFSPVDDASLSLSDKARQRSRRRSTPISPPPQDAGEIAEDHTDMDSSGTLF